MLLEREGEREVFHIYTKQHVMHALSNSTNNKHASVHEYMSDHPGIYLGGQPQEISFPSPEKYRQAT